MEGQIGWGNDGNTCCFKTKNAFAQKKVVVKKKKKAMATKKNLWQNMKVNSKTIKIV